MMIPKNNSMIKITRDNKTLFLSYLFHNIKRPNEHFKYNLNLNSSDFNNIFSFYGENGTGKSTISNEFYESFINNIYVQKSWLSKVKYKERNENCQIMNVKKELNCIFNSDCIFSPNTENYLFFNDFLYDSLNDLIEYDENSCFGYEIKLDKYDESIGFYSGEKLTKKEYNDMEIKIANKLFEKGVLDNEELKSVYRRVKEDIGHTGGIYIHYISRELEYFAIHEMKSLNYILANFARYKNIFLSAGRYLSILIRDDVLIQEIILFFERILFKAQKMTVDYKNKIKEGGKILDFIDKNLKKEFIVLSKSYLSDLIIEEKYSSFLNTNYKEIFIKESHKSCEKTNLQDFLEKSSEGQNKLLKMLFVLGKIGEISNNKSIIIADDIFDSFDNNNFFNIVILLKKTLKVKNPTLLLFTHDFEIFGMVNKGLKIKEGSSFFMSRINKNIQISSLYIKDLTLEEYIKSKNKNPDSIQIKVLHFLILCVYGRNLVERTLGQKDPYYEKITSLLHIKINSKETISNANEIANLKFLDSFSGEDIKEIENFGKSFSSYYYMIRNVFNYAKKADIGKIELNIFLSLYGRIYIEQTILKKITKNIKERNILLSSIKTYQTGYLLKKYENDVNINALNDYITKFIHINQGLSYLVNIDSKILLKLIDNIK